MLALVFRWMSWLLWTEFIVYILCTILYCHRHSATSKLPHQLNAFVTCHRYEKKWDVRREKEWKRYRIGSFRTFKQSPNECIITCHLLFHFRFSVKLFWLRCLAVLHRNRERATVCYDLCTLCTVHYALCTHSLYAQNNNKNYCISFLFAHCFYVRPFVTPNNNEHWTNFTIFIHVGIGCFVARATI